MARKYTSQVRQRQVEETRTAIVSAAAQLLASTPPDISMPEVAERASVGVATVYRYFPNKDELFDAVYDDWMASARDLLAGVELQSLDDLLDILGELWGRQAMNEPLERAMSLRSPVGLATRRRRRNRRRQVVVDLLEGVTSQLPDAEARALNAVVLLLTSTAARAHMSEYWDFNSAQAARVSRWAVRTLVRAAVRHGVTLESGSPSVRMGR